MDGNKTTDLLLQHRGWRRDRNSTQPYAMPVCNRKYALSFGDSLQYAGNCIDISECAYVQDGAVNDTLLALHTERLCVPS